MKRINFQSNQIMGTTCRLLKQTKFVCACLFLLVTSTLANIDRVEKTSNEITNNINDQDEVKTPAQIERRPDGRDIGDIVIESLEDGLLGASSANNSNDRHHYEQPPASLNQQQLEQQEPKQVAASQPAAPANLPMSQESLLLPQPNSKPEPRNHQEDQQLEPVIIDHRPTGSLEHPSTGLSHATGSIQDFVQQSSGQTNSQTAPVGQSTPSSQSGAATGQQVQSTQQQQQHVSTNQPASGWQGGFQTSPSAQQQQIQQQYSQQPVGATSSQQSNSNNNNFGNPMMASSNQIISVQHPTSINSIINDQQNQGQLANMAQQQSAPVQATMSTSPTGQQATTSMLSLNGQPVYLVNPSIQGALGARRQSISNWLRGISSMLASIFNRREHGNQLLSGQASSPSGHWIQLGPSAPHWLTQAQSLIQQQQQQFQQQFGNTNPSQQMLGSASTNRYATIIQAPQMVASQQQQPMSLTVQPAAVLSGQAQAQNQLMQAGYPMTAPNNNDLQSSSSSNNYVAIQRPLNQPQSQFSNQANNLVQYQPSSVAGSTSSPSTGATFADQSSFQTSGALPHLVQTSANNQQQISRQSSATVEQPKQTSTSNPPSTASSGNQPATVWSSSSPPQSSAASSQSQPRFSRSSSLAASSQNLPLAHYSRY